MQNGRCPASEGSVHGVTIDIPRKRIGNASTISTG